jgi:hypothetical protein
LQRIAAGDGVSKKYMIIDTFGTIIVCLLDIFEYGVEATRTRN